jgi:ferredoxin like protein
MSAPVNGSIVVNVEDKLFQNRYKVDHGHPHISIKKPEACVTCKDQPCTFVCPAGCYRAEADKAVVLTTDGCMECGTCRVVCTENVVWEYPRGGHGVLFKFG